MAWLMINTFNGVDYYSVLHDKYKKTGEFSLGPVRYIEITEAEAALSLDKLILLYKAEQEALKKKEEPQSEEELALAAEAKVKHDDLVERITRIIKESNQPGEVDSAKGFYKTITGKDWVG